VVQGYSVCRGCGAVYRRNLGGAIISGALAVGALYAQPWAESQGLDPAIALGAALLFGFFAVKNLRKRWYRFNA
jgi:hypothetical protein